MAQVSAGCLLERLPSPHSSLLSPEEGKEPISFFEFAPRAPFPTLATLARFRKQVKAPVEIALVAPKAMLTSPRGPLRPGKELDEAVDWLTRVADILKAFAIVLPTGAELTPGERDKGLLADFVKRLGVKGARVVIAPRGLWEADDAALFAAKIGAVYGFDPLEDDAPPGDLVYGRVKPMGARARLSEGLLVQVAERMARAQAITAGSPAPGGPPHQGRGYVSIESDSAVRDMKRLSQAIAGVELDDEEPEDDEAEFDEELEAEELDGDEP